LNVSSLSNKQLMLRRKGKRLHGNSLLPGYPGLTHTAHLIAEYIPKSKIYVEPFAGLGRLTRHIQAETIILNDKSDYAFKHNQKFKSAIIEQLDFIDCIKKYDSENTFFLIDPPWRYGIYFHNKDPVCDLKPIEYYIKLFKLLPILKGNWILCSDKDEHEIKKICSKSGYPILKLDSKKSLFKKKIGVLLTSNKPFIRYNQKILFENLITE